MNKWILPFSLILALGVSATHAAGDAAAGKTKSASCAACHGADGNSANPLWPKLAGQSPAYLTKQLKDFKSGARKDPTMTAMAAPLSDADITDIVAYFSTQKIAPASAAEAQVEFGQQIWRAGNPTTDVAACAACHGPTGMGIPSAMFPRLSYQHADYIAKQLKDFQAGTRSNDKNNMMGGVSHRMTAEEIKAVSQYAQGLH